MEKDGASHEAHIFSDASEQAYGAVAYLRTTDKRGQVYLSFMVARSRVAPKRSHSIPRLELCGALVAAQLAKLLQKELTSTNRDHSVMDRLFHCPDLAEL